MMKKKILKMKKQSIELDINKNNEIEDFNNKNK